MQDTALQILQQMLSLGTSALLLLILAFLGLGIGGIVALFLQGWRLNLPRR